MDENGELRQKLGTELQWVQYRQKMLDIIESKLQQMREIAEQAKEGNHSTEELDSLTVKMINLALQINALDEESRKIDDEKILE